MKKAQSNHDDLTEVVKRLARVVERQQEEIERLNRSRPLPQPYYPWPYYPWPWYQRPYISWAVPMSDTVTNVPPQSGTTWTTVYQSNIPGSTTLAIGEGNA